MRSDSSKPEQEKIQTCIEYSSPSSVSDVILLVENTKSISFFSKRLSSSKASPLDSVSVQKVRSGYGTFVDVFQPAHL